MTEKLPDLSRFELQCLRRVWERGEASVREVQTAFDPPPTYSTLRKIFERLEEKGAVKRVRRQGRAWVYRSAVRPSTMIRRELRRFLDTLFDGSAGPLIAHLADMDELSVQDVQELEKRLDKRGRRKGEGT